MTDAMRRGLNALSLSALVFIAGCHDAEGDESSDEDHAPVDIQALLWCVLSAGGGETPDGEQVGVITTSTNRGACLCLPIGTQPYTGSELDELLHDMAIDKCEEDLRALGAATTDCEERVPERPVDYESPCDPDDWPPPPM
jgi:hypothetical protein